jgi:hypothetical protein
VPGRRLLLRRRAAVVAIGLLARLGRPRALALWPALDRPLFAVDLSDRRPATWLRATFESRTTDGAPRSLRARLRARLDAATWSAVRARGLLLGDPGPVAIAAVEAALERPLERPRVALYSPSGAPTGKANLFVFERGRREPTALAVAMARSALDGRLRYEVEAVEAIRTRVGDSAEVTGALPLPPLRAAEVGGRYVVVFPIDPLASRTGVEDRERASDWLLAFQAATASSPASAIDRERELAVIEEAWSILRPDRTERVLRWASNELERLADLSFRPCGVHGDYWRGNIASDGGALRVYDWEWWRESDHPLFDPWTYELADVRWWAESDPGGLEAALGSSLERIEAEAEARGLERAAARALLLSVLGELAVRGRRVSGRQSPPEIPYARVMAAAERLLEIS